MGSAHLPLLAKRSVRFLRSGSRSLLPYSFRKVEGMTREEFLNQFITVFNQRTTGFVDRPLAVWWLEVEELAQRGFDREYERIVV